MRGVRVAMGCALLGVATWLAACAGKTPRANTAAPAPSASVAAEDAGPVERPFAASASEATQLVNDAVDGKSDAIRLCVRAARQRRGDPHSRVDIEFGIDQEGHLIGVKLASKQPADASLLACVRDALRTAPFPRSHAGVITITRTYEEIQL
jgi:outer membrane biosynthesis protein TonB